MDYQQIEVEDRDEIRLITLNRPERLNAWTHRMNAEMAHAIRTGNDDPTIGAFVMTGAGRAFCAGADISDVFAAQLDGDEAEPDAEIEAERVDWVTLMRTSKPIVAAINGASVGVGLSMTLSMDFLVARPEAKLSCRFVKMGVTPELASSHFLVQRCGWGNASDLTLSGRIVLGAEALQLGLVDEVAHDVVSAAIARARSYAENSPPAVRLTKELLTTNGSATDLKAIQRVELAALDQAYQTAEHREAVDAFLEKRPPKFR